MISQIWRLHIGPFPKRQRKCYCSTMKVKYSKFRAKKWIFKKMLNIQGKRLDLAYDCFSTALLLSASLTASFLKKFLIILFAFFFLEGNQRSERLTNNGYIWSLLIQNHLVSKAFLEFKNLIWKCGRLQQIWCTH